MHIARSLVIAVAASFVLMLAAPPSDAQITINIPKLPKIKKDKPAPTTTAPSTTTSSPTSTSTSTRTSTETESAPVKKACSDAVTQVYLEDIAKYRAEAEEFRPGLRDYFVSTASDGKNKYLEAAMIPRVRKEWDTWDKEFRDCVYPALDGLAEAARKTIGGYTGPAGYNSGTPAEKKILLSAINDLAEGKVLKVGIKQPNWLIAKDNYNFPTARYRHGYAYVQYPAKGLCMVFWINLVQDYAGGGTYGASYGNFISRSLAGCPAK